MQESGGAQATALSGGLPALLACVIGEVVNLAGAHLLLLLEPLRIPLFLDTIGTVAVTFYAGLLPGIIVALLFNVIRTIQIALVNGTEIYPWEMLYMLCGATIAAVTWAFARRKENFCINRQITILYLVLIALLSAFASSVVGGLVETVNRIFFDGIHNRFLTEYFVRAFMGENMGMFVSCVLARIPMTLMDRVICTFAGYGLYALAKKYTHHGSV